MGDETRIPYDDHAEEAARAGFHGHRGSGHSDVVSDGIVRDLRKKCPLLKTELDSCRVGYWRNKDIPFGDDVDWAGDLVIAEPLPESVEGKERPSEAPWNGAAALPGAVPDGRRLRIVMEHKTVLTAHRNKTNRLVDLERFMKGANAAGPNVIAGGTVMVGTALKVLNVVDKIRPQYRIKAKPPTYDEEKFDREIRSRLQRKDNGMWEEFAWAVSENTQSDPKKTVDFFSRSLPIRPPDRRSQVGFDALLLVPAYYDNVGTAYIDRGNTLGIDVDAAYADFIGRVVRAYETIWGSGGRTRR